MKRFLVLFFVMQLVVECGVAQKTIPIPPEIVIEQIKIDNIAYRKKYDVYRDYDTLYRYAPRDLIFMYGRVSNDSMVSALEYQIHHENLGAYNLKLVGRMLVHINTKKSYLVLLDNMDVEIKRNYGLMGVGGDKFLVFPIARAIFGEPGFSYDLFDFLLQSDYLQTFQNKEYLTVDDKIYFIFRLYVQANSNYEETARQLAYRKGYDYEYGYFLNHVKEVTRKSHGKKRKVLKEVLRRIRKDKRTRRRPNRFRKWGARNSVF